VTAAVALDTSGSVWLPHGQLANTYWEDLTPVEQRYIEELFSDLNKRRRRLTRTGSRRYGFADLAPEALARIREDCEAIRAASPDFEGCEADFGRWAWGERSAGNWPLLPPIILRPGDDGLLYLRDAQT
jgi:hypothetical protein